MNSGRRNFTLLAAGMLSAVFFSIPARAVHAQCVSCSKEDHCERGRSGGACTSLRMGQDTDCVIHGECTCEKIVRRWWFDTEICSPSFAAAPPQPMQGNGVPRNLDVRVVEHGGATLLLRRVGPRYFAAAQCGSDEWAVLGRELPDGTLAVTTNPLAIRLRRRAHDLDFAEFRVATGP